ncbi:MAG TPA: polysaccharide biosynthesis tyrosine autokinase [Nostocaceae cyanobacterium]|nr:polysaccharide biosynthesis tyrosine autokinase [Nostocaceae cyanobacterium]
MQSRETFDVDFTRYTAALKRRWLTLVTIFSTTVTLSAVSTTLLKPPYEAEGKLLFKPPAFNVVGQSLLSSNSEGENDLRSLVSTQNPISTQMEVLTSVPVLEKTIQELKLKNKEGQLLKPEELQKSLNLKIIGGTDVLKITYTSKNAKEAAAIVNKLMNVYLENDIANSQMEAKATSKVLLKQLPQTERDYHVAEVELRRFREKYRVVDLAEESRSAVVVIANLNSQITNLQAELKRVTTQTNELQRKVALNSQQAIALSAISQSPGVQGVLKDLQDLNKQLATERSRFTENNPVIINLVAKKANLESLLQQEIQQTVGNSIQLPTEVLQVGELRQSLIKDFIQSEVQRLALITQINSLYNSQFSYQQRAKIIPKLIQNERELEQKVEAAKSTYQTLLKKLLELELAANKNAPNARIIALAEVPEKPLSGKKPLIIVLGVILGSFLSTTTVLVIEMRDISLKSLAEVREVFGYTLLGIIPLVTKTNHFYHQRNSEKQEKTINPVVRLIGERISPISRLLPGFSTRLYNSATSSQDTDTNAPEIIVRDAPESFTSEMYRIINANLKFLSSDKKLKVIVISSAVPKEGKSTVSANLATAISQLGRQVLLIDADMRLSSQHEIWQLTNIPGLSEILVGQAEFNSVVNRVLDNLDVLSAGVRPPNPLALLDSKRMATLIQDFGQKYDFVIIDAPPIILAADALVLSQMTDGILLVARPGVIDSASAVTAKEMLARSGQNVLGLLVNGINTKNEFNSYFYHAQEYFSQSSEENRFTRKK